MVRKIAERVPNEVLQRDLERYRQRAVELGATDAKIITTDQVIIDERVRAKCIWPKCEIYGTSANCPPYSMDLDLVRKIVNRFQYAIFTRLLVPSEEVSGQEAMNKHLFIRSTIDNYRILANIEAEAFYDGYHLALAFADGTCKVFCLNVECSALIPGQACRQPLKARASMESVGMDAFTMAAKVGWDIYPVGSSTKPSEIPHGTKLGLVLIY